MIFKFLKNVQLKAYLYPLIALEVINVRRAMRMSNITINEMVAKLFVPGDKILPSCYYMSGMTGLHNIRVRQRSRSTERYATSTICSYWKYSPSFIPSERPVLSIR